MFMDLSEYDSQSHAKWHCQYHVVITPKYRKKTLFGHKRQEIGKIIAELIKQKEGEVLEGHAMPDHLHMLLSIPPKYSVSHVIGFLKGKSAIRMHLQFGKGRTHLSQKSFWSRGYCVSTVGINEDIIRRYIKDQEDSDKRNDGTQQDFGWN